MTGRVGNIAPVYLDTGRLRPQDDVDLDVFIDSGDRAIVGDGVAQPFFSGRERELAAFYKTLFHFGRGYRENLTQVVEGPPGAGKSALMAQCMAQTREFEVPRSGGRWLPVRLPAAAAGSPGELAARINEAIARRLAAPDGRNERQVLLVDTAELAGRAPPDERAEAHAAAEFVSAALERLVGATRDAFDRAMGEIRQKARDLYETAKGGTVTRILDRGVGAFGVSVGARQDGEAAQFHEVTRENERAWAPYSIVLFIDEAQNIPVDTRLQQVKDFFCSIHEGTTRAKLAVCAFGLTGTSDKLRAAGVSRLQVGRFHRLGVLGVEDCRKAVRRCFAQFGVRGAGRWEDVVVERAAQWPQHLAGYLTSAMSKLRECPLDHGGFDAASADLPAAMAQGDAIRHYYYEDRAKALGPSLEWAQELALALRHRASPAGPGEIREALEARLGTSVSEEAMHAFIANSLYAGLLAPDARHATRYVMPIPSLAAFLRGEEP